MVVVVVVVGTTGGKYVGANVRGCVGFLVVVVVVVVNGGKYVGAKVLISYDCCSVLVDAL